MAFAALLAGCILIGGGYIAWTAASQRRAIVETLPSSSASVVATESPAASAILESPGASGTATATGRAPTASADPHASELVFQNVVRDETYARVATVPLANVAGQRTVSGLTCERVYYAGGHGLCLVPENGLVSSYDALTFGPDFVPRAKIPLAGAPSRARVSADGRYGAATVFVFGHSYADIYFSTQTIIIDMATGTSLGDMEKSFTVFRDGKPFSSQDFNFWGITFAPANSDEFYATLRTGGTNYLVHGSVSQRTVTIMDEGIECPSISPDGTRIAFKKRVQTGIGSAWHLSVLNIATLKETALAETQDIDDQPEWLDDQTVLYGLEGSIWRVPADGSGSSAIFVKDALSPAVVP